MSYTPLSQLCKWTFSSFRFKQKCSSFEEKKGEKRTALFEDSEEDPSPHKKYKLSLSHREHTHEYTFLFVRSSLLKSFSFAAIE